MSQDAELPVSSTVVEYVPYRPAVEGPFRDRFYAAARHLTAGAPEDYTMREALIAAEIEWAVIGITVNPPQRRIYRAAWLLLRDLLRAGWLCRWYDERLEIAPPPDRLTPRNSIQLDQAKQRIRDAMVAERAARLRTYRDFIQAVERDRPSGQGRPSILTLVADGSALSADLRRVASLHNTEERERALGELIRPYLQLVSEGERCAFTGHLLSDIWRYFRFTWTTPSYNTPGRNLFYLIRDAGRANHPVMGIAALANAPLRIQKRDEYFGWTVDAFVRTVHERWEETRDVEAVHAWFSHLRTQIDQGIGGIDPTGLASADELTHPSPGLFKRLALEATRSIDERAAALRDWSQYLSRTVDREDTAEEDDSPTRSKYGNISQRAQEALFRKKRALELIRLLRARRYFNTRLQGDQFAQNWAAALASEEGRAAISAALMAMKNTHVGSSIMELSICGAIPPYNELLGGKLVALLMLSPEVVADYRARYGRTPSQIASQLKGADVVRSAELIYLGTTSLYSAGSSQYNRLGLPAGLLRPDGPPVRYRLLGMTSGYGTLHIADETTKALEEASSEAGYVEVNHIFGEGGSPKLRVLRRALDSIFEQFPGAREATDQIAMHRMTRLVYGVDLAANTVAYLQGWSDQPDYYFDPAAAPRAATARISAYWVERWLSRRIMQPGILERVAASDREELRVGRGLDGANGHYQPIGEEGTAMSTSSDPHRAMRELIRSLYRGTGACADATDEEQLRLLHVPTRLDETILQQARAGRSVILTGNPGDGKTHLLRVLAPQLAAAGALVELDASARTYQQIHRAWQTAMAREVPYCLAINEAILFSLAKRYPDFSPLQNAVQQVREAVGYGETGAANIAQVVVFDLSRRNVLAAATVREVIKHLTDPAVTGDCPECGADSDFAVNQRLLREPRVQERLQLLLDRVSRRGYHATMRELQAFISYLLFAGRTPEQMRATSGSDAFALPQLVYGGTGELFDEVRRTFDPVRVAHPIWDERLVNGDTRAEDWLVSGRGGVASLEAGALSAFEARKRAFFFFHAQGAELLDLASGDEQQFFQLLTESESRAVRQVVRLLNRFFSSNDSVDRLAIWQSHHYNQEGPRILYSSGSIDRTDLEIVKPVLAPPMHAGFDLAVDHFVLRPRQQKEVLLRVDYPLFVALAQAERGLPTRLLQENIARRLWQFLDRLAGERALDREELRVTIIDPASGEEMLVEVNVAKPVYVGMKVVEKAR